MDVTWTVKYITEFLGTAILVILGNGAVANVELKGTKGHASGWLTIAIGYGMGVMIPALMFGNVSGNHINPAFTLGLATSGLFPWAQVLPYICAQMLGAIVGQGVVVATHKPYYLQTTNPNAILGTFSTIVNVDNGKKETRNGALVNGFINEFFGSFILFLGAMAMTKNFFGGEILQYASSQGVDVSSMQAKLQIGSQINAGLAVGHLGLGFLVMALVTSLGGPTGPALNPARDLGPRLLHYFLPKSVLGENKGDSKWWYSWVPVIAPILAGLAAVALFKYLYT
ncbi:aquaglyceroporin Gla [Streptococcus macacae]|uniref:Glycerol facilitator-aquaporin n=1 Tax=Streptococcus macacae NCTC 11558 TaxID=764298 RepID=G5JXX2_9STRE|nr:aquaglyceroporin Gla [Streptococcus macacae]EHJ52571.1 glycerol facilitator-aquaporin [Streptococcus macacae NCTC 11558]SUN77891.1 putative glycerol uptake facilitator protein [Streptococcus macacae NCTC 11558]